ncbi:imidazole glycerol phosphate synthase subunit HisH [Marinicella sp. W31]|uniref:imidazole glycerol phosphate synthase subunit HisH n=1 Tax=Marinicella sp. W31 TaxID=3023713 RepID=UPI003757C3C3
MKSPKIGIIDLKSGNLLSIQTAIQEAGFETEIISEPNDQFDALVMPGQGRFAFIAEQLNQQGWRNFLDQWLASGKPLIGICVGMQILFENSAEDPQAKGLGWLPGQVQKLPHPKTPMVGWSQLHSSDNNLNNEYAYFVNSFAVPDSEFTTAYSYYGGAFCAAVQKNNLYGFQFHPEKSGAFGRQLIADCLNKAQHQNTLTRGSSDHSNLAPRIIPCLDVAYGRVVKGTNFKQLQDMGDPVELAYTYEQQGADEVVFLDIKASIDNRDSALDMVYKVATTLSIPFTVGGGINVLDDVDRFFNAGADKVTINSAAVSNPKLINQVSEKYGRQSLIVAIDVNREADGSLCIYTHGGSRPVDKDYHQWLDEVVDRGAGEILLTAMHKDGTGSGFDCDLLAEFGNNYPVQIIASGGAKGPDDFVNAINSHADAVLAAGLFHRGEYTVKQIKEHLIQNHIAMRV